MGQTNAERQAALRAKREKDGLVSLTVFVPKNQVAQIKAAIAQLVAYPYLEIGTLRDTRTGKLARADK